MTVGKIEKSNASFIFIAVNNTNNANVILMIIKKLSNQCGRGIMSIATTIITAAKTPKSRICIDVPPAFLR